MGGRDDSALLFGRDDSELLFGSKPQAAEPVEKPPTGLINQPPAAPTAPAPAESGAAFTPISRNIAAQGAKLKQKADEQEKAPVIGGDRSWGDFFQDLGLSAQIGTVNLGESAVGLADLGTIGYAGKGAAAVGYNAKQTKEALIEWQASDKQKAFNKAVADAGVGKGFIDQFAAAVKINVANPEFMLGSVIESVPSMLAAGGGARAVAQKIFSRELAVGAAAGLTPAAAIEAAGAAVTASKSAILWAGAAGEGALAAGSIGNEAREAGRTWSQYVLPALAGGAATALIGRGAASIPGMGDADTALFTRGLGGVASAGGGRAARTAKSMFQEGVLEEMPQSTSEAMFGNLAQGKPAGENLGSAAGQGLVLGMAMGGGMGAISKTPQTTENTRGTEFAKAFQSDLDRANFTQDGSERAALAAMDPNGPSAIDPSDTRLPVNPQPPAPPAGGAAVTPGDQWAAGSDIPNTRFSGAPNVTAAGGLLATIESTVMGTPTVDDAIDAATKAATQLTPNYAPFAETPGVTDTFRTARGSTYALFDDGTTQRNRSGEGHANTETGLQPRSVATVFMNDMLIDKIGKVIQNEDIATRLVPNLQNNMLMVESADGQLLTTASFSTTPEVGMSPVEIFGNESPVGDRGTNVHFGSTITEVNPLTETTTTEGTANAQTTETVTPETGSETPAIQVVETPSVGGGLINTPTTGTLAGGVAVTGTATEAAAPRVEDGETYVAAAVTGTPFTATLLRGQGREDSPYNSLGAQVPILGQGSYTTPDRAYAEYFGPNVTEQTVTLQNPLVISNDDQWRALTKEAGWAFPNPFGQDTEKTAADIATLRSQLEAKGYDGVVIQVPASELTGKTLGDVFGASQAIVFNPPTAGGVPTVETPAGGGAAQVSINDITDLVITKNVSGLAALTQQLTGKAQLEELNPVELTAVHDALTMDTHPLPLPSHMASVSQELYGVPAAVEAAKTERNNTPITDQVNERGIGETPERSMDALTAAKANIGKLNGQLAGGAKTGATAGGLMEAWSGYHRVLNDILASRKENPKLWADYAERQAQVAQLNVGDTALNAIPSPNNPFGQPVTILKKNPKTWSVQEAGGATLNVLPVTLRPVAVAPAAGTPAGGAPTAGTPAGGAATGGTPTGGAPTGGTPAGGTPTAGTPTAGTPAGGTPTGGTPTGGAPASEIKADTPVTPRQSKLRWEAEKPGAEAIHTTLAEVPHVITPEGAFHYVRDAAAPKKLVLTAGFVSPEAQAAYEKETAAAAQKKITEELDKDPMKVAIDTADAAAVAELIYGKTVEDEFLPIIFPDEKLIRMAVDPAQLDVVEAALSKYGFRITDRSVPVKTDDPATTGPERISVSALYHPGRTDIQDAGADFTGNRKGKTTTPPVPKDPTDSQISKMLSAVSKDTLFEVNVGTFGAVMFKEGMVANIKDAADYLYKAISSVRYLSSTTGNRQAIKLALKEGIDVAAMLGRYVAAANKLQGIFNDSKNVDDLVKALNTAYIADEYAVGDAMYTADGLALRDQLTNQKLSAYINRMRDLFLANENSSDQTNRIVKKDADVPPELGNIIRRGMRDHRQGRDVDVQDFLTTFGFFPGGISFGNWVNQSERAAHLNAVYDSLYDMADLSGIDPIMLGLGEKLKLAIGAQGRGGKTAAWFIPGANEINLTKTKGDGTVAHEWHHGLDHNLRNTINGNLLMTDTVTALRSFLNADRVNDILRGVLKDTANNAENRNTPPKKAFFAAIASGRYGEAGEVYRRATGQTGFYQQAKKLDEGGSEPYWAKPTEMLSRAFEAMLFDASKGGTPYLVGPSRADGYMSPANGYKAMPYPSGEERARLNEQLKVMLAQIDSKTLEIKTYAANTNIIEIDGLGFAVVDQNSLGSGEGTLTWHKTRALAETEQKASNANGGEKRILTPYKLQVSKTNIAILEMATDVDAIIEEMGLFKWPEVKNGSMAESMFFHMRQGWWPKNNADLIEYAGKAFIQQPKLLGYDPDTYAGRESIAAFKPSKLDDVKRKQTQEDFEAAASRYVGQIITDMRAAGSDDEAIYRHIVDLYATQPLLNVQNTTSITNQAYSTPLPIAYLSGLLARVANTTTVLEPTAGNGLLAITANPKNVIALELEHHRADNLKLMEFGRVEQGDALVLLDGIRDQETDVLLTNPPFGSLPTPINVLSWTGASYRISKIDQLIAAKALRGIADNGRAVLILGAHLKPGTITSTDRIFLNWVYSNYNVADHFELAGKLYHKQGSDYPIRVLVIAGRNQTESAFPPDFVISRINTFDELWSRYVQARDNSEKVMVGAGKAQPKAGGGNIAAGGLRTGNTLENGNVGGQTRAGGGIQNGQPNQPGGRGVTAGAAGQLGASGQPNAGELTGAGNGQLGVAGEGGTSQQGSGDVGGAKSADAELGGISDIDLDAIFDDLDEPKQKRAPKSTGPKAPGTPSAPRGPRKPSAPRGPIAVPENLKGIEGLDALMTELGAALGVSTTETVKPQDNPLVNEAIERIARQTDTENKGGNDDPASGLYSRKGETNYADVQPILQRVWDAIGTRITDLKERIKAVYEYLKAAFGATIKDHLRAFVNSKRVQIIERPANQTPIQSEPVDTESQVVYYGKSRYNSEGIYLPRSQAEFTYAALENLEAQEGDIDEFVAKELGYASTDEMAKGLAGYQIDALGLAISANNMGKGFVVGDDTGVGKGRTAAAMLVWAKKNGKVPIFVSLNETLYSDMYRDLKDIGHGDLRIGMTNTESEIIEDIGNGRSRKLFENKKGDGNKLTSFLTKNGALPPNIDIIFTTYSQLGGSGSAGRQAAIASLIGSGKAAIVMDEAHNAAGDSNTNAYFMSLLTGEGLFGKDAAGDAKPAPADWAPPPALYLSATFAKRPDNMPLYIHTNLRYAADTPDELKELFGRGAGTDVLQQIASEMLVKSGSMIRRERSYDGVKMSFITDEDNAPRDAREVDNITAVLRTLVTADRALKEWIKDASVQSQIVSLLGPAGSSMGVTGNSFNDVQGTPFTSVVHNYVSQLLLATKIKTAVDTTVAKMNDSETVDGKTVEKSNEKVVLALQNTMEALLKDYVTANNVREGGELANLGWQTVLRRGVDSTRRITLKSATGQKKDNIKVTIPFDMMPPSIRAGYAKVDAMIQAFQSSLPVSPIDAIRQQLEAKFVWTEDGKVKVGDEAPAGVNARHLVVKEISGRTHGVDYRYDVPRYMELDDPDRVAVIAGFQNGDKSQETGPVDVVILTAAGATGISLHASVNAFDQRPRHMIILQPHADISVFKQLLGRIHRTGQVLWPSFTMLATGIPAERRIMAVIKKKMSSLVSNTSAGSSTTSMRGVDFINQYGDVSVARYLNDHSDIRVFMDYPEWEQVEDAAGRDVALKASGRAGLLPVTDQQEFFDSVESDYNTEIERRNATGTNALQRNVYPFNATLEESAMLDEGLDPNNPFTAGVAMDRYSVDIVGEVPSQAKVEDAINQSLAGRSASDVVSQIESDLKITYDEAHSQLISQQRDLQAAEIAPNVTDKEKEILAAQLEAIQTRIDLFSERREKTLTALRDNYPIGSGYNIFEINDVPSSAVVVSYTVNKSQSKTGNPYAPSNFKVNFQRNLPGLRVPVSLATLEGNTVTKEDFYRNPNLADWFALKSAIGGRQKIYIATGNILHATKLLQGKGGEIANFTLDTGKTVPGLKMPPKYNPGPLAQQRYTLRTPAAAAQFALSAWAAVLQKKWVDTGSDEYLDANKAIDKLSFTKSIPDAAVVLNESSSVIQGKNKSWTLMLDFYSPLRGYKLVVDAKNKKLITNKTLLGLLKGNDLTRRSRNVPVLTSSAPIDDPQQILDLMQFLHKQSAAAVSPDLAPFAKEVVKADFDIAEAKRKGGSAGLPSRAGAVTEGQTAEAVRSQLVALEGINVQVVQSASQLPEASAPADVEGVWYSGNTVYLVADNLPNATRVQQVLAHEAIGHAAMEAMLGPKLMAELINNVQNLEKTGQRLVRDVAAQVDRTQPGLSADRRAKEIIAVMAERGEHVKGALWQRTLYAVRQWLRSKGFDIAFSESDVLAALRDAETFAKRGPTPSGVATAVANAFPQYSIRSVTNDVTSYTAQLLHTDETFNWWHRSVGTQQHKAFINADFAKVYDESQKFLADVSTFANTAADEALSLLPRIERFRDFTKKSPSEADVKSAMDATMAGTLYGGGSPLQGRKWNAGELAAGRADDALPGSAQAFTPLTPDQIKLYFEGQAAVGVALDNFTKGVIHRLTSRHGVAFDVEMSLEDGADLVREQLQDKADEQTLRIDTLRQGFGGLNPQDPRDVIKRNRLLEEIATAESQHAVFEGLVSEVTVVEDRATSLKDHGYFPAMRFGRFAVYITHENPVTKAVSQVYFGLFESQTKANLAAMALAKEYPGDKITRGAVSQEQYALFQGLSLDALENFADHITDTNGNAISKDPLVQGFLKAAVAERSALKRQIHRKGVAGYSDEMPRVLASYILSMSRTAASYFHSTEMDAYTRAIKDGSVKDEAIKLVSYLKNPVEEAQAIRGLLFTQFLGGSIAHGIINATSPIIITFPYLSQYTTATNASLKIAAAAKQNVNKLTGDVLDAYLRAKKEGVVAPQEIHQLRAESGGAPIFGNSLALRKLSFAWGAIYAVTEQMNRTTTFLAAYNIAKEANRADAYEFAVKAVNETQFVYNKGNRPNWARGAIGATVFTFKQFSVSYLELAKRMYDLKDPNGKRNLKPFALLLLLLLVGGGVEGLPFAEDMEDLVDTIGQWLGYATNSKKWVHKFFAEAFGSEELGRVASRGISGFNWMPVDVSLRFGMGNLIPGTTLLKPSEKNKAKALLEFAGPIGQFVPFEGTMAGKALEKLRKVDYEGGFTTAAKGVGGAALDAAPVAIQNLGKGIQMAYTGQYPDARNRQGVKVTGGEAALKMIGLQPSSVANQAARLRDIYEDIAIQRQVEGDIVESWANAIVDKNPKGVDRAIARVREWNSENPQLKIAINNAQLRERVREMLIPQNTRIIRNAPRELRGSIAQDLAR